MYNIFPATHVQVGGVEEDGHDDGTALALEDDHLQALCAVILVSHR